MILDLSKTRIFIRPGATDMRKQINGLSLLVEEEMEQNVFSGSLFLFSNKRNDRLKILYWDKTGFCLWLKRLEKNRFPWPENPSDAREITYDQLKMLLTGIDFFHAHQTLDFSSLN